MIKKERKKESEVVVRIQSITKNGNKKIRILQNIHTYVCTCVDGELNACEAKNFEKTLCKESEFLFLFTLRFFGNEKVDFFFFFL